MGSSIHLFADFFSQFSVDHVDDREGFDQISILRFGESNSLFIEFIFRLLNIEHFMFEKIKKLLKHDFINIQANENFKEFERLRIKADDLKIKWEIAIEDLVMRRNDSRQSYFEQFCKSVKEKWEEFTKKVQDDKEKLLKEKELYKQNISAINLLSISCLEAIGRERKEKQQDRLDNFLNLHSQQVVKHSNFIEKIDLLKCGLKQKASKFICKVSFKAMKTASMLSDSYLHFLEVVVNRIEDGRQLQCHECKIGNNISLELNCDPSSVTIRFGLKKYLNRLSYTYASVGNDIIYNNLKDILQNDLITQSVEIIDLGDFKTTVNLKTIEVKYFYENDDTSNAGQNEEKNIADIDANEESKKVVVDESEEIKNNCEYTPKYTDLFNEFKHLIANIKKPKSLNLNYDKVQNPQTIANTTASDRSKDEIALKQSPITLYINYSVENASKLSSVLSQLRTKVNLFTANEITTANLNRTWDVYKSDIKLLNKRFNECQNIFALKIDNFKRYVNNGLQLVRSDEIVHDKGINTICSTDMNRLHKVAYETFNLRDFQIVKDAIFVLLLRETVYVFCLMAFSITNEADLETFPAEKDRRDIFTQLRNQTDQSVAIDVQQLSSCVGKIYSKKKNMLELIKTAKCYCGEIKISVDPITVVSISIHFLFKST
jgi:hypothetical protein